MNRIELNGKSQGKGRNGYFQLHSVELMNIPTDPDGQVLHVDFTRSGASTVLAQRDYCSAWRTLRNWRSFSERLSETGLRWQTSSTANWCASVAIEVRRASKNGVTKSLTPL